MPNIKSAKKRVITSQGSAMRNQMFKSALKTAVKNFDRALQGGDKSEIDTAYKTAVKKIDSAVTRGVLHKNTAARKKSAMAKKLA